MVNLNGHSALHKAAVKGHAALCAWLLGPGGLGAAELRPDGDGNAPSRMARAGGHRRLSEALLEMEQAAEKRS